MHYNLLLLIMNVITLNYVIIKNKNLGGAKKQDDIFRY